MDDIISDICLFFLNRIMTGIPIPKQLTDSPIKVYTAYIPNDPIVKTPDSKQSINGIMREFAITGGSGARNHNSFFDLERKNVPIAPITVAIVPKIISIKPYGLMILAIKHPTETAAIPHDPK